MKIKFDIMLDKKVLSKGCTFEHPSKEILVVILFATRWAAKQFSFKNLSIDNVKEVKNA